MLYMQYLYKIATYTKVIFIKLDVRTSFGVFLEFGELPVFTGDPMVKLRDGDFFFGVDVPMDSNEPAAKVHFVALTFKDIAYTETNNTRGNSNNR